MGTFDFYLGLNLLHTILVHADNLSRTLQSSKMSAAEGQHLAKLTTTLSTIRNDASFALFWDKEELDARSLDIGEPILSRKRRLPSDREVGSSSGTQPSLPMDHYKRIYFEALDTVTASLADRFDQDGYHMYRKLETVLLEKDSPLEAVDDIIALYKDDFSRDLLVSQLQIFHQNYPLPSGSISASIHDVITLVQGLSVAEKEFISEIVKVVQLLLVMPATNLISERSFSAMRRTKTFLRSTMLQERLNAVMISHVHKDATDNIDLKLLNNDFVSKCDYRKSKFPLY